MPEQDFPLVGGAIRSVWTLELLIHLRRQRGAWDAATLARELRANEPMVVEALSTLVAGGLLIREASGAHAYAPVSPLLDAQADALEKAYRERPVSVINAIVASSTDTLRSFADAFRIRGDSE